MKISKKTRQSIERALQCLSEATQDLNSPGTLGVARSIVEDRALGSDYNLRNPKVMESTSGLSEVCRISSIHGSKVVMAWTAMDILKGMLSADTCARQKSLV